MWVAGLVAASAGCGAPARPSVTVASGRPLSPAPDASVSYYSQPLTLTVSPGLTTAGERPINVVEVATDATFGSIVMTRPVGISAAGSSTVTLDRLDASTTYYWRVTTSVGSETRVVSPASRLSVGPPLVLGAPTPVQPLADSYPTLRPTFVVKDAARSGPPARLAYAFELSRDTTFARPIATGTVAETADETRFAPGIELTPGATYFWRARASADDLGVTGNYSAPQPFTIGFPGDGTYRYTLVVRAAPACVLLTGSGPCGGGAASPWPKADFAFDGMLTVEGDTMRFQMPPAEGPFNSGPPRVTLTRFGDRVTGAIAGTTPDTDVRAVTSVTMAGTLTGQTDNLGRFDGEFAGRMGLWRFGFPCDRSWYCPVRVSSDWGDLPGFRWTLLPQ